MKLKTQEKWWIGVFITLWMLVSTVSTIHSVEFFKLSNSTILAWILALGFELGAIASLGGLIISRGGKGLIWFLFIVLTAFQIHGNMYWAWVNAGDLKEWIHLLDLIDENPDTQKRIFTIISGGILPIVALGFMKSLMDYLSPKRLEKVEDDQEVDEIENIGEESSLEDFIEDSLIDAEVDEILESEELNIQESEMFTEREQEEKKTKPFWSQLHPAQTLRVLKDSDNKIKKGTADSSEK